MKYTTTIVKLGNYNIEVCAETCPYNPPTKIGSAGCFYCQNYIDWDSYKKEVYCKMDSEKIMFIT